MNKKIPVLFLIFNREEITLKAFASIKEYRPDKLYIAADGPRANKQNEAQLCESTRRSVLEAVDWECEIKTLFRDKNLGCTMAVASGIDWFFANEEYGIIVEDDCFIHPDFYSLCEILLPHYKDEEKVMLITAQNHTPDLKHANQLVFTNVAYIWGWASWRRAWEKMDMNMTQWSQTKFRDLVKNFGFLYGCYMLVYWYRDHKNPKHGSWDTRWSFSVFCNHGICVSPNVCLSNNLGIEEGGAHYDKGDTNPYTHLPFGSINFPIQIPNRVSLTKQKLLAERKEFIRIRKIGLKKKIKKLLRLI